MVIFFFLSGEKLSGCHSSIKLSTKSVSLTSATAAAAVAAAAAAAEEGNIYDEKLWRKTFRTINVVWPWILRLNLSRLPPRSNDLSASRWYTVFSVWTYDCHREPEIVPTEVGYEQ